MSDWFVAWLKPPIVAPAVLALGIWLHMRLAPAWGTPFRSLVCAAVAGGAGFLLLGWALLGFLRRRTPVWPGTRPEVLVTEGPYRFSRNPMYVATALVFAGFALAAGSWPMLLPLLGYCLVMDRFYIRHEEGRMAARFGAEYEAYRSRVRRWL